MDCGGEGGGSVGAVAAGGGLLSFVGEAGEGIGGEERYRIHCGSSVTSSPGVRIALEERLG